MQEEVFISQVLERCDALSAAGIWDRPPLLNPRGWLNNFADSDKAVAATLLANLIYVSNDATKRLFRAAFAKLQQHCFAPNKAHNELIAGFNSLVASTTLVAITGEEPSDVDSGKQFARMARDVIGLSEGQIANHERAVDLAEQGRPIAFVDDILGTGSQLINMWEKSLNGRSFKTLHEEHPFKCYAIFPLATADGLKNLSDSRIPIQVHCAHIIDKDNSLHDLQDEPLLPNIGSLQRRALDLAKKHCKPERAPLVESDYLGFGSLALLVLFSHSAPDFSLPILSKRDSGFEPLFSVGAL